jgi:phosphoribosylanthranilate isomerase
LKPENVAAAIKQVGPFGVDVASGVESSPGRKDRVRLRAFFIAVQSS